MTRRPQAARNGLACARFGVGGIDRNVYGNHGILNGAIDTSESPFICPLGETSNRSLYRPWAAWGRWQREMKTMKINPNDLAFPTSDIVHHRGLTKRELMATMICAGVVSNTESLSWTPGEFARDSVGIADALIAELNKEP